MTQTVTLTATAILTLTSAAYGAAHPLVTPDGATGVYAGVVAVVLGLVMVLVMGARKARR